MFFSRSNSTLIFDESWKRLWSDVLFDFFVCSRRTSVIGREQQKYIILSLCIHTQRSKLCLSVFSGPDTILGQAFADKTGHHNSPRPEEFRWDPDASERYKGI